MHISFPNKITLPRPKMTPTHWVLRAVKIERLLVTNGVESNEARFVQNISVVSCSSRPLYVYNLSLKSYPTPSEKKIFECPSKVSILSTNVITLVRTVVHELISKRK